MVALVLLSSGVDVLRAVACYHRRGIVRCPLPELLGRTRHDDAHLTVQEALTAISLCSSFLNDERHLHGGSGPVATSKSRTICNDVC